MTKSIRGCRTPGAVQRAPGLASTVVRAVLLAVVRAVLLAVVRAVLLPVVRAGLNRTHARSCYREAKNVMAKGRSQWQGK